MQEVATPEVKPEQPPQVIMFPFPACMSSLRYDRATLHEAMHRTLVSGIYEQ